MFRSAVRTEEVTPAQAEAAMSEVRQRFPGATPIFAMRGDRPVVNIAPPATPAGPAPQTVRILAWDVREGQLSRINLPFSLLRLGNDPIEFEGMALAIEDVERYGRALLLDDDTFDGKHVLIWSD